MAEKTYSQAGAPGRRNAFNPSGWAVMLLHLGRWRRVATVPTELEAEKIAREYQALSGGVVQVSKHVDARRSRHQHSKAPGQCRGRALAMETYGGGLR